MHWKLLNEFTKSMSLDILNNMFPLDTFTYLCPTKYSTSWLDHIICSRNLVGRISNVKVSYDVAIYDHFPLSFSMTLPTHYIYCNDNNRVRCDYVKWDKIFVKDKEMIKIYFDNEIVNKRNS